MTEILFEENNRPIVDASQECVDNSQRHVQLKQPKSRANVSLLGRIWETKLI